MAAVVTLAEEKDAADLVPFYGASAAVGPRRARFLKPRAEADPSTSPAPRRPLLRDLVPRGMARQWPIRVFFRGWHVPQYGWQRWVQRLRPVFRKVWRSAGIRDAVTVSTCTVLADVPLFWSLLECWSPETNTFVFPWPCPAEATVTLEDVMILGGFSVFGEPVLAAAEGDELLAWLTAEHRAIGTRNGSGIVSQQEWTSRFMGLVPGEPDEREHAAFIALWLSGYVFPAPPLRSVGTHLFPLAVRLARGTRVALAPAVLASIYRDLRLLKQNAIEDEDCASGVESWAPFQFLQLWAWERLESLRPPQPPRPLSQGQVRSKRWDNLPQRWSSLPLLRTVLESPSQFRWRPYAAMLTDWSYPSFYCYGDRWVTVGPGEADDDMRSYARCLRACKLVGLDGVEHYAPQRVAMQFGLDQDLPGYILPDHGAWELALAAYGRGGERVRFYVPPRFYEPCATRRFLDWQKQCALDRIDEVWKMAKLRKKEKEKRRRLRRKRKHPIKDTSLMPNPERCLRIGTRHLHGHGVSPVGEEPTELRAHGDEQRRTGKEEILTEDEENKTGSSDDAGAVKRMRRAESGKSSSALEVFDRELDRDKESFVLEINAQQSSYDSNITKVPEAGMLPCGITEIGRGDEELQTRAAGEASALEMEAGEKEDDDIPNKDAQKVSSGFFMPEDPEAGLSPSKITIIESESSDEELQRQKDLEFEKEVAQMKAEIAGLRALIRDLESNSPQMEPTRTYSSNQRETLSGLVKATHKYMKQSFW